MYLFTVIKELLFSTYTYTVIIIIYLVISAEVDLKLPNLFFNLHILSLFTAEKNLLLVNTLNSVYYLFNFFLLLLLDNIIKN